MQSSNDYLERIALALEGGSITIASTENLSQVGGTAVSTSSGAADAGTQRVAIGGVQETVTATQVSASGSVAAGARSVLFVTSSDFAGTILGLTRGASEQIGIAAQAGNTLSAIAYTRSAGTLDIYKNV